MDDFHLITPEDIESESPPSIRQTIGAHAKTSHPTLSPLLIPDPKTSRLSTHTANSFQKTIDSSPTPTLTEVAHITSSFPQPPSHLPTAIPSTASACTYNHPNTKIQLFIRPAGILHPSPSPIPIPPSPSVSSPLAAEGSVGNPPSLQNIKFLTRGILRIPSLLSLWKSRK